MSNRTAADAWKTIFAIFLFLFSIVVALVVAQVTSLWDWLNPLTRRAATWPVMQPHVEMYRLGREEWNAIEAHRETLDVREMDLQGRAARLEQEQRELRAAQNELELERSRLASLEQALAERERQIAEREAAQTSLEGLREVYGAMRPQEAAAILTDLQAEEIAVLLVDMQPRQAGSILAALPKEKAAAVSRLMGL